jgi:transposase
MRPYGTAQQLEKRRRQAIRLFRAGKSLSAVARALSASVSSVFRWVHTYRAKGPRGLQPRPTPGRPPKLSGAQRERLKRVLLKGPLAAGYPTDLWTLKRVAEVVTHLFQVEYHPCHVWRLLHSLGWSCQKPERRALQRNEAEIVHWKRHRWPHIKKRRKVWGPSRVPG